MTTIQKIAGTFGIIIMVNMTGNYLIKQPMRDAAVAQDTTATHEEVIDAMTDVFCSELAQGIDIHKASYRAGASNRQYKSQIAEMAKDMDSFNENLFLATYHKCEADLTAAMEADLNE